MSARPKFYKPGKRVAWQMKEYHNPTLTLSEHLNEQLNRLPPPYPYQYDIQWRDMVTDIIERVFSVARARNIEIPSAAISLDAEGVDGPIKMQLLAMDNVGTTHTLPILFRKDHDRSPGAHCIFWTYFGGNTRSKWMLFHINAHAESTLGLGNGNGIYISPQCVVESIVATYIEPIYGGPYAFDGTLKRKLVPEKDCTCPPYVKK